MTLLQNKHQVFGTKTKRDKKKTEKGWGEMEEEEEVVKTRDDLQLFWVLSWSMKLTSCHARLATMFHNIFLFTVETAWNSP